MKSCIDRSALYLEFLANDIMRRHIFFRKINIFDILQNWLARCEWLLVIVLKLPSRPEKAYSIEAND